MEWTVVGFRHSRSFRIWRERPGGKGPYDMVYYVSPGKSRERRFKTHGEAQAFADKLNQIAASQAAKKETKE